MRYLNTYRIFESESEKSILGDIDVIDSFFDDLDDDKFKFFVKITICSGNPHKVFNDTASALVYLRKNEVVGTIAYHIGISKVKGTVEDYNLLKKHTESFKGRLLDFTYCRIDSLTMYNYNQHREIFTNKDGVVTTDISDMTANISMTNIQKKRNNEAPK